MKLQERVITMLLLVLCSAILKAQEKPTPKVHGYCFGDYFGKLEGDTSEISPSQYSQVPKDFNGFQFRRIYLYVEHTLSDNFFSQFLLEGNDKAFEPGGKHGVFVKTAYLEWKNAIPRSSALFGLVPTPTWSLLSEKVWNYRSIEKTIIDFRGFGSASDMGVLLRGRFDSAGTVNYTIMVGNGNGQKPENNKYKKYYGGIFVKPTKEFVVEAYADFQPAAQDRNVMTLKGFAAYQSSKFTVGVEAFQQTQNKADSAGNDKKPLGVSVFAWVPIPNVQNLNGFARFDFFDPDTEVDSVGFKEMFFAAGVDFMPISNVHFMPNVWVNSFSAKESGDKDADIVARLTVFYTYK
ncbi:MAG TPA: hypothetical protein VN285_11525 [Candidatus Deferrimicrobium sp.]|nr:hypothetical protein [Candidatus Deferrimicrobium sp.]